MTCGAATNRVSAVRERLWLMAAAVAIAAEAAGCAKAQPPFEAEMPPLEAPPPPPRLLPPLVGGPVEPPEIALPPPEAGPPSAPTRRLEAARPGENAGSRQEARPAELPKTEPLVDAPRAPEETSPAEQPPMLQLAPSPESNTTEHAIRQLLARATQDLGRVDYGALSPDAKVQYDTAKRFMVLADQAIKDRNFVFARTLADKAAVIAGVLVSR
jgi:hypothetical protein